VHEGSNDEQHRIAGDEHGDGAHGIQGLLDRIYKPASKPDQGVRYAHRRADTRERQPSSGLHHPVIYTLVRIPILTTIPDTVKNADM
jgi:hypothetical protein